jgi:hypothetical protein
VNRPLWLLCAAFALAAPARAQEEFDETARAPAEGEQVRQHAPAEAERAMAQFSRCTVDNGSLRRRAERFVRLIPGRPDYSAEAVAIATSRCVPLQTDGQATMRFPPVLFRSALFSAFYRREFARTAPADMGSVPPLSLANEFEGDVATLPQELRFIRAIGDCAARADTARVHALLRTEVGSDEERPALDAAIPVLSSCLPAGRELRFSRGMLRGILAEGLYKLRKAAAARPATAPAGGGG